VGSPGDVGRVLNPRGALQPRFRPAQSRLRTESPPHVLRAYSGVVVRTMRPEFDFTSMKGGVRGKYVKRFRAGTNLVLLDPELSEAFPTDAAVNQALRAVLNIAKVVRLPDKALPAAPRKARRG